jgi:hypothetical protein
VKPRGPSRSRHSFSLATARSAAGVSAKSSPGTFSSSSASHVVASESLGARQSPRGDSDPPEPTFGPFGIALRLNCDCAKKRCRNTRNQRRTSPRSYARCSSLGTSGHAPRDSSRQAFQARNATLLGR